MQLEQQVYASHSRFEIGAAHRYLVIAGALFAGIGTADVDLVEIDEAPAVAAVFHGADE